MLHNFKVEKQQSFGALFTLWHAKKDSSLALAPCSRKKTDIFQILNCHRRPTNFNLQISNLSFMGLHSVCRSCCTGSDHWCCLWAGNSCLDVPEVLNCTSCSLPCVVWAFSDSESLPEDRIESYEELYHESSLLSGASNIIWWISSMSVK